MGKGYIEGCLWDFKANAAELEVLRLEHKFLMSVRGQNYEAHGENGISNPVFEVTSRRLSLEHRIARLEKRIIPIEKLQAGLIGTDMRIAQMRDVLRLRYLGHNSHEDVQRKMAVSSATYWRRRRELLNTARKYFGNVV